MRPTETTLILMDLLDLQLLIREYDYANRSKRLKQYLSEREKLLKKISTENILDIIIDYDLVTKIGLE